jgi:hypothetical protein
MAAKAERAHSWSRSGVPTAVEVAPVGSPRFIGHVGGRTRRTRLEEAPHWVGHGGGASKFACSGEVQRGAAAELPNSLAPVAD